MNVFEVLLDLMETGTQRHRLGLKIAQQHNQHIALAPVSEALGDCPFLIV